MLSLCEYKNCKNIGIINLIIEDEILNVCYMHQDINIHKRKYDDVNDDLRCNCSKIRDNIINGIRTKNLEFGNMIIRCVICDEDIVLYCKTYNKMNVVIYNHLYGDYYNLLEERDYIPYEFTYKKVCDELYNNVNMLLNKIPRDIIEIIKEYL